MAQALPRETPTSDEPVDAASYTGRAHADGEAAIDLKLSLKLLDVVDGTQDHSQRSLAAQLGIALGLTNAYVKRCVSKGLIKIRAAPAKRFAYYLTPQGFAEKARLTAEYLTTSLSLFRQARDQFTVLYSQASARGLRRVLLIGDGDLAEIAVVAAIDSDVRLVGVVAPGRNDLTYLGLPVLQSLDHAPAASFDGVVIATVNNPQDQYHAAIMKIDDFQVFAPPLIGVRRQGAPINTDFDETSAGDAAV